jgi:4a-hydroxytetrahydrobiopterin dehydratase
MGTATPRLDRSEAEERLNRLDGWSVREDHLVKTFEFPDFVSAVSFVNRVAEVAEQAGHHPDIHLSWGKVVLELTSHDAGGLTVRDFDLAASIDGLVGTESMS